MIQYYKSRTPREQAMLLGMLALLALFVVWQFIIKPVLTMSADADRAQTAALRDYNIVTSGASLMAGQPGRASGVAAFDRSVIVSLAAQQDLPISRLQKEPGGALKVWFEDVESQQVYGFLTSVTEGYAASIAGVQLSRRNDGRISAQITLQGS